VDVSDMARSLGLHNYRQGARRGRGNVMMPEIAYSTDGDDIKAIAHLMSRQRADATPWPLWRRPASSHGLGEPGTK
jgi:cytochrome c553